MMNKTIGDLLRAELEGYERELGRLPMPIDEIMHWEMRGFAVDLITGAITSDSDRFALSPSGEALAVIIGTGFLDEEGRS
jgi:hypothetical protein